MIRILPVLCLLFASTANGSATTESRAVTPTPSDVAPVVEASEAPVSSSPNAVVQLANYVKDSFVRTVDGCGEMWRNHGKCNEIRSRQRDFRENLRTQWTDAGMDRDVIKERLKNIQGGINYEDYAFLQKGKEDRGKLMNLVFLMWGAPRFLPYALMFYPDMLPSPFLPPKDDLATRLAKSSRERSHAVLHTLINLERDAHVVPFTAKLNIFGRKAQQLQLKRMQDFVDRGVDLLQASARGNAGARQIMMNLQEHFQGIDRKDVRLVNLPGGITNGLNEALYGPSLMSRITPRFFTRGKILGHLRKIEQADDFLLKEKVDIQSISSSRLWEACNDRLIGGPGQSDEELQEQLETWLELSQNHPNANLARVALLCYYAVDSTRDPRTSSRLSPTLYIPPPPAVDEKPKQILKIRLKRGEGSNS